MRFLTHQVWRKIYKPSKIAYREIDRVGETFQILQ